MYFFNKIYYRIIFYFKYRTFKPIKIINEHLICVSSSKGNYSLPRRCPHKGAFLEKGYLYDNVLVCSWHGCKFYINIKGKKV